MALRTYALLDRRQRWAVPGDASVELVGHDVLECLLKCYCMGGWPIRANLRSAINLGLPNMLRAAWDRIGRLAAALRVDTLAVCWAAERAPEAGARCAGGVRDMSYIPLRLAVWLLLVALLVGADLPVTAADPGPVASPSATPTPAPATTPTPRPAPGDGGLTPGVLAWEPVGPPYVQPDRSLGHLVAWRNGFAALETRWSRRDSWVAGIALSPDGRAWSRTAVPVGMRRTVELLPLRRGLVAVTDERPEDAGWGVVEYGFWRSLDAVRWRHVGGLSYRVPADLARRNCQAGDRYFASIGGALMLYVALCWDPCCGYRPGPAGSVLATLSSTFTGPRRTGGVIAWRSTNAATWRRQPLRGLDPEGGRDYGIDVRSAPGELLVLREAQPYTPLRTSDGIRFTPFGTVPPGLDVYGSLELIPSESSVLLLGESFDHEGGYGNTLVGWVMDADGTTTETLVQQPAFTRQYLASGSTILVLGRAWGEGPSTSTEDDDEEWAWIIGSRDGGRTWDDDLAWTGGDGSCVGEVAAHEGVAVMTACGRGDGSDVHTANRVPAFWVAPWTPGAWGS